MAHGPGEGRALALLVRNHNSPRRSLFRRSCGRNRWIRWILFPIESQFRLICSFESASADQNTQAAPAVGFLFQNANRRTRDRGPRYDPIRGAFSRKHKQVTAPGAAQVSMGDVDERFPNAIPVEIGERMQIAWSVAIPVFLEILLEKAMEPLNLGLR